jgi:hypothetical protein
VRRAIQHSQESIAKLAARYDLNPRTIATWKKRPSVHDASMGPKQPHSTVLTKEEEALIVTCRRHTLVRLDDCLYALQLAVSWSVHCRGLPSEGSRGQARVGGDRGVAHPFRQRPSLAPSTVGPGSVTRLEAAARGSKETQPPQFEGGGLSRHI